jgi:hypothetical protein
MAWHGSARARCMRRMVPHTLGNLDLLGLPLQKIRRKIRRPGNLDLFDFSPRKIRRPAWSPDKFRATYPVPDKFRATYPVRLYRAEIVQTS